MDKYGIGVKDIIRSVQELIVIKKDISTNEDASSPVLSAGKNISSDIDLNGHGISKNVRFFISNS